MIIIVSYNDNTDDNDINNNNNNNNNNNYCYNKSVNNNIRMGMIIVIIIRLMVLTLVTWVSTYEKPDEQCIIETAELGKWYLGLQIESYFIEACLLYSSEL